MNMGGKCIGCTMPGFPDKFTPYFREPPGSNISGAGSRILGAIMRPLRKKTMSNLDRETRWDDSPGLEERLYAWFRERGANYDDERGLERRPNPERAGGN
jgi:hydrogenase small subunit